ncbi:hypothetical protein FB451DRAFT_1170242 [Mycena latifolia]|nr:hypothetical protein FB451DRAFT_1170242 [Mycena latifolia]
MESEGVSFFSSLPFSLHSVAHAEELKASAPTPAPPRIRTCDSTAKTHPTDSHLTAGSGSAHACAGLIAAPAGGGTKMYSHSVCMKETRTQCIDLSLIVLEPWGPGALLAAVDVPLTYLLQDSERELIVLRLNLPPLAAYLIALGPWGHGRGAWTVSHARIGMANKVQIPSAGSGSPNS